MRTRRSLIDLDDLSADELEHLFARAAAFENKLPGKLLDQVSCVNMFFEQSTRTYTSFNLAELRLGALVVNLAPKDLSLATKGETIEDTALTLSAMGIELLVVRHPDAGFPKRVAQAFDGHLINAGDGSHAHPTQALLDIFTMLSDFGNLAGRTIAIVGDVMHSRVAHSAIVGFARLGANVVLVGPACFLPDDFHLAGARVERNLDAVLHDADAIMLLRIQRERFTEMPIDDAEYIRDYRLDSARLDRLREATVILHPGPYNRGVELDDSVLDFVGWRYAKQVRNGVFVRMAVLDFLVNGA